ncbi:DNA-3-methyladenine glycosylase family protein [Clostridium sp. 'White wine YQ']|uniref:DNA-3-methyladenine glycosylase family protein n=1 Tax=Clostridium sp. 'White wine YQ' TaxID=3027474 RepID=UPI0023665AEE|nr:DNA glycosylase [Clostridium sp. 'White wine YQ']MDD7795777.1 DNA glycosylase [Clostridium sp. 'White wine YQ']
MDFERIEYAENSVKLIGCKNFSVKQTIECGQCFRWEKVNENNYIIVAHERVIELEQIGEDVLILNTNKEDFEDIWQDYFDLERDYSMIKEELSKDELLKKAVEYGYGIRLLNQDPYEILISFIISARNSIPIIMKTIRRISERWGKELDYKGKKYFAFPTIEEFSKASLEEIVETGASFRSKYIYDTLIKLNEAKGNRDDEFSLERITYLEDDECHNELQKFKGVGAKVADCIMLFSMKKYSAFPVDVWVKRAMQHFYLAPDVSLPKIRIFGREKFGKLSGFAQQYLFYYARENKIKID